MKKTNTHKQKKKKPHWKIVKKTDCRKRLTFKIKRELRKITPINFEFLGIPQKKKTQIKTCICICEGGVGLMMGYPRASLLSRKWLNFSINH